MRSCVQKVNRNHVTEKSIFNGLVVWNQGNEEARQNDFPELFEELIQLNKMSAEVLEETVLKVDLVTKSCECLHLITKSACKRSKSDSLVNIVSFGGTDSQGKCIEVYNDSNKPSTNYPDLPQHVSFHCSLLSNNFVYCVGGSINNDNEKLIAQSNVWRLNLDDPDLEWEKVAPLKQRRCLMGGAVFH